MLPVQRSTSSTTIVVVATCFQQNNLPLLQEVCDALKSSVSPLLKQICENCDSPAVLEILAAMDSIVDPEVELSTSAMLTSIQQCYCIRPGVSKYLDAAKERFNAVSEEVHNEV